MEGGVICVSVRWTRYSNGYTYYVYELRQEKYPKNVHDGILLRETLPRILVRRGLETGIREEIRSLYTYISRVNHVIFDLGIFVSS